MVILDRTMVRQGHRPHPIRDRRVVPQKAGSVGVAQERCVAGTQPAISSNCTSPSGGCDDCRVEFSPILVAGVRSPRPAVKRKRSDIVVMAPIPKGFAQLRALIREQFLDHRLVDAPIVRQMDQVLVGDGAHRGIAERASPRKRRHTVSESTQTDR